MRIVLAVLAGLLFSCVPSPPRPVAPASTQTSQPSQPQQAHVVSASTGDRTARAYDAIAHALQLLDRPAPADSKHLYLAAHLAGTTAHLAASTVRRIERARRAGTWNAALHYQVAGGAVLDGNQLVTNLIAMQGRALARQRDLHVRLFAAYRADFPRANGLQLAELNRLGPPAKVAVIAVPGARGRHHRKKTRVSCWIWSKRKSFLATCWTPQGTIAMRDQWKKTGQVAARGSHSRRARSAPAGAAPAPADESTAAVESSIDTSDIPASDTASDSTASDMSSADDATAAASADTSDSSGEAASSDTGSSDSTASDSSDTSSSDTSASDTSASDSSSSDSSSSDSNSSDSSSSDSSSSESSSSDSSSSDSSDSAAPSEPAQPACLPDGAETDDWNKCCGGHWSHHTGEDGHTCCSEIGGDCS